MGCGCRCQELLNHCDIKTILQHFKDQTCQEDPVIYFYETFLAAYDPKMREMRGVYYTPEPVVSYIVRSVDEILKRDFGLKRDLLQMVEEKQKRERNYLTLRRNTIER